MHKKIKFWFTTMVAGLLMGLSQSQVSAQAATPPARTKCIEGRLADGITCIPPLMAQMARNKAIILGNARISHTGPAQPPSGDALYYDRPLAARLFLFNARHLSFGP